MTQAANIAGTKYGFNAKQLVFLAIILTLNAIEGIDQQLFAVTLPKIASEWHRTPADFSLAMAASFAGMAIGTPLGGIYGDKIGRKPTMIIGITICAFAVLAMAFCQSPMQLISTRAIVGLGIGACFPPTIALLAEGSNPKFRSTALGLALLCQPFGFALAGILAKIILPISGWQSAYIYAALATFIITGAIVFLLPESPSFLAKKPETLSKAEKITKDLGLDSINLNPPKAEVKKVSLGSVFKAVGLWPILGLFVAFYFIYLTMSCVLSWMPSFLTSKEFPIAVAATITSSWSLFGMAGTFATGIAVAKWGSGKTANFMVIGACIGMLTIALLAFIFDEQQSFGLILFYGAIGLTGFLLSGTTTTLFSLATETFPDDVRSSGLGFATMIGKIGGICGALGGSVTILLPNVASFFLALAIPIFIAYLMFNLRKIMAKPAIV